MVSDGGDGGGEEMRLVYSRWRIFFLSYSSVVGASGDAFRAKAPRGEEGCVVADRAGGGDAGEDVGWPEEWAGGFVEGGIHPQKFYTQAPLWRGDGCASGTGGLGGVAYSGWSILVGMEWLEYLSGGVADVLGAVHHQLSQLSRWGRCGIRVHLRAT